MANRFVQKLRNLAFLNDEDVAELQRATMGCRRVAARQDLIREGDRPGSMFVMLDGWACRYKLLPEGGRQITAFLMPGDSCDAHVAVAEAMDDSIQTLTEARVATIDRRAIAMLLDQRPRIARALWSAQLAEAGTLRAWIANMGRRSSLARAAHLMCELHRRGRDIGLADGNALELPVTQIVLADALGLTPVHMNRVLRQLRQDGVMEFRERSLLIRDARRLAEIAGFDENYLHRSRAA